MDNLIPAVIRVCEPKTSRVCIICSRNADKVFQTLDLITSALGILQLNQWLRKASRPTIEVLRVMSRGASYNDITVTDVFHAHIKEATTDNSLKIPRHNEQQA